MDFDDFMAQMEVAKRPHIAKKPWMETVTFELVTRETLPRVIDECIASKLYALDLETTGLDTRVYDGRTVCSIVGACVSPDGQKGYYIPVRHTEHMDVCIPVSEFEAQLRRLLDSDSVAIFHNGKFDQEFIQFSGSNEPLNEWDDPKKWEDTLILAYLRDTHTKNKGLKALSKKELDMEMIELNELFTTEEMDEGDGYNFAILNPSWEPVLWYAASDAICTYRLYHKLHKAALVPYDGRIAVKDGVTFVEKHVAGSGGTAVPSQTTVYTIEKLCVAATRWMERNRIPIDRPKVAELIKLGQREWLPALTEVYEEASRVLGRNISPGYIRLLMDKNGPYFFDPDFVGNSAEITQGDDTTLKGRLDRARLEAEKAKMDPTEFRNGQQRIITLPKSVPKIGDPGNSETIEFPVVYDIIIPDQLGLLLRELGVEGLSLTEKSEQIKTSKGELDRVIEEAGEQFPFIPKVKRFREVAKALASNLQPIYDDTDPSRSPDCTIRVNFEAFKVDTGRFSTPQPREGRGFTGTVRWNLHSIPAAYDPKKPACMLRLREIVAAPEGSTIVAIDYSGQELRVATNFSGEPKWVDEFFRCATCGHTFNRGGTVPPPPEPPPPFCPNILPNGKRCNSDKIGDLHSLTALSVFGESIKDNPKEFKAARQKAKGLNFAMCYGGGGMAAQRSVGCSKEEGWRIKHQFDKTYKGLAGWWKRQHEYAKNTGVVLTALNRRIHLPDIHHPNGFFQSKAERNATNGPIQGSGADIMKLAMGLIYRECKRRGWLRRVRMIITIHDELVFSIDNDLLNEALPILKDIMLRQATSKLAWQVPLTCDVEAGHDWSVPWNLTKIEHGIEEMPEELAKYVVLVSSKPTKEEAPPEVDEEPKEKVLVQEHGLPPTLAMTLASMEQVQTKDAPPVEAAVSGPEPAFAPTMMPASIKPGDPYVYKIPRQDLTYKIMTHMAKIIHRCSGRGPYVLRVQVSETGESLWDGTVYVNPMEFSVLMSMPEF